MRLLERAVQRLILQPEALERLVGGELDEDLPLRPRGVTHVRARHSGAAAGAHALEIPIEGLESGLVEPEVFKLLAVRLRASRVEVSTGVGMVADAQRACERAMVEDAQRTM